MVSPLRKTQDKILGAADDAKDAILQGVETVKNSSTALMVVAGFAIVLAAIALIVSVVK